MKEGWKMIDFEFCLDKTKNTTKLQSSLYGEQGAFPIVSQEKEYTDDEIKLLTNFQEQYFESEIIR